MEKAVNNYLPNKLTNEIKLIKKLKHAARKRVQNALKDGRLIKESCLICDDPDVQAHHYDYAEPLSVIWLCKVHHKQAERDIPAPQPRISIDEVKRLKVWT